jgi:alginate O-acetyltransferase complex protein AlgI
VWGALHGGALAVERLLGLHQNRGWSRHAAVRAVWFVVVQSVVLTAWVFFRSRSVGDARQFAANIVAMDDWSLGTMEAIGVLFLLPIVGLHLATWLRERGVVGEPGPAVKAVLAAAMVYGIATLYAGTADFIYFQF